jgi:hypothetical protein
MSDNLLGKKSNPKARPGRSFEVLGTIKNTERVNIRWDDDTVSVSVRLSDLEIVG